MFFAHPISVAAEIAAGHDQEVSRALSDAHDHFVSRACNAECL
jgi:hypothetical protein